MTRESLAVPTPEPATRSGSIWLVRHAPTAWTGIRWCGRSDPELTPAGRAAAMRIARDVEAEVRDATGSGRPPGAVVLSSPLRRSLDTAGAIAVALGAPIWIDPDLAEIDFGVADGLTWDELLVAQPALATTIIAGGEHDWPGGETRAAVDARSARASARIRALSGSAPVVVVSHGGLLSAIATHLGRVPRDRNVELSPLRLEPATMIRIDVTGPASAAAPAVRR
jgi:probable phosphoglycerate mutase